MDDSTAAVPDVTAVLQSIDAPDTDLPSSQPASEEVTASEEVSATMTKEDSSNLG